MTITYSLDVANTRFCGFTKLLKRWKGSIYKILWKELLIFCMCYSVLSVTYRCFLDEKRKRIFEDVVLYCETFVDLIPLSFVLGFYVSLVIGRWWNQFDAIPWPDRTCLLIATFVHGSDERSRTIRRTLGRYLILLQMFTFQAVSTAVKKRFPTLEHVEAAGLITKEEKTIFEKVHIPYGKWWLPAHWFCAVAMRARKEGRIKDSMLLKSLLGELLNYRSACGTMFNYDWISVPLVYTQVVTLATYTYSIALLMGRQYLDPAKGYDRHQVDLYVPFFTLLQLFFYVGWLKVAEQIVNPYGEDDDDFELNWCLDRNAQIVYMLVDHLHTKHPKLKRDHFWDELEPQLPHTKFTVKNLINPQLGSAANLEIDPTKTDFLPMETLLEEDTDSNHYDSVKHPSGMRYRPSVLMNMLSSGLGYSFRRGKSTKRGSLSDASNHNVQGHTNNGFVLEKTRKSSLTPTNSFSSSTGRKHFSSPRHSRASSIIKRSSPTNSRSSSLSIRQTSVNKHRHKYDVLQAEVLQSGSPLQNGGFVTDDDNNSVVMLSVIKTADDKIEKNDNTTLSVSDSATGQKSLEGTSPPFMPPIPEEPSRPSSMAFLDTPPQIPIQQQQQQHEDGIYNLVVEANKVLEDLNRAVSLQGHKKDCEQLGYESCCSLSSDEDSSNDSILDETTTTEIPYDTSIVIEPYIENGVGGNDIEYIRSVSEVL